MMNVNWNHLSHGTDRDSGKSAWAVSPDLWFYQLEEFYDEKLVLSHVREALKDRGVPDRCETINVGYAFKKSFQVAYRLSFENNMESDVILLVRFYPRGESPKWYQEALAGSSDKDSVVHLPGWDAVAWIFPEDPRLSFLPAMVDTQSIVHCLSQHIGRSFDPDRIRWRLMSYRPGKRCSIRYELPPTDHVLIGKMQESTAEGHDTMARLWEYPDRRFRMPRPIGLDEELGVRWESFVVGKRIEDLFSQVALDSLMERVARDLAGLHHIPMDHLMPNGLEQVIHRINQKIMPRIHQTFSPLRPTIDAFYKALIQKADLLPESSRTTIHGDLHTANVLMDQEGLIFVDMDRLGIGDPAYDLALFGGRLLLTALHRGERIREVANAIADLPDAYEAAAGHTIPERTFAWYMAALLIGRQMNICIRYRAPSLGQLALALLTCARETLERERFDRSIVI